MQSFKEAQTLFQKNSLNLPMVEHEEKLNLMLDYLKGELEKDKKELQILRQDIIHENYLKSQQNEDTSLAFIEDLADFTRYFRSLADADVQEMRDLSKQCDNVKMEKIKIKKESDVLDHKVREMENVLGVGLKET